MAHIPSPVSIYHKTALKNYLLGKKKRLNIVMPPLLYVSKPFLPSDVNLIFYLSGDGIFKQLDCAHSTFFFFSYVKSKDPDFKT